jgi:hypothetical protein
VVKNAAQDRTLLRKNMAANGMDEVIMVCISFLRGLDPPYLYLCIVRNKEIKKNNDKIEIRH